MTLICAAFAWSFIAMISWQVFSLFKEGVAKVQQLHQIPCDRCMFHTESPMLKCTVHPMTAFSEAAIECFDFEALNSPLHPTLPNASAPPSRGSH